MAHWHQSQAANYAVANALGKGRDSGTGDRGSRLTVASWTRVVAAVDGAAASWCRRR